MPSAALTPPPEVVPDDAALPNVGKMTITLTDNGTSRPTPLITFDPVGRFTPGMMHDYLPHFARSIDQAQAQVRRASSQATLALHPSSVERSA